MSEQLTQQSRDARRKRHSIFLRPLLWGALIAAAFWIGAHWRDALGWVGLAPGDAPAAREAPAAEAKDSAASGTIPTRGSSAGSEAEPTAEGTASLESSVSGAPLPQAPLERTPGVLSDGETRTIELFRSSSPSVVNIDALEQRLDRFSMRVFEVPRGSGSGIVWDERGHVVTNYHVVSDRRGRPLRARVTLHDQSVWEAEFIGGAPEKDLAVLRIDAPRDLLRPIRPGTSSDLLVGQSVFAIGNPFGLDYTLTTGVISALGREIESLDRLPIRDVIQTDAAINPGNSGGPLLDSRGRLVGVNTQIYSPSGGSAGIGFAIPVDTVAWVVPELIEHGRVLRPSLGISTLNDAIAGRYGIEGVAVLAIDPDSNAAKSGLRAARRTGRGVALGDIIVAIDRQPVKDSNDLVLLMERFDVGDRVVVTVDREGERRDLEIVLSATR